MSHRTALHTVAFLADYLPRRCGIATFTADLRCLGNSKHVFLGLGTPDSESSMG